MTAPPEHPDSLVEAVAEFIDRRGLLPPGAAVVAAVSGGADSVAMLDILRRLARAAVRAYRLTVAHLNHRLRADAGEDAEFVRRLAEGLGLPCVIRQRDVAAEAARTGVGVEQAARAARYEFLVQASVEARAGFVAVGHHADDNAETVLYRVLRGTHLRGLAGMPVRRTLLSGQTGAGGVVLVRPMLECRRSDIEAYCARRGLVWRTDSTNADTAYRRNFIRHELLPLIRRELNPRADEALLRLAASANDVEQFLEAAAEEALRLAAREDGAGGLRIDRDALWRCPPPVRAVAMRMAVERLGAGLRNIGADRLEELAALADDDGPAAVCLSGGWLARREGGSVLIGRQTAPASPADGWGVLEVNCPGEIVLPGGERIVCRIEGLPAGEHARRLADRRPGEELLDADQLRGRLVCRKRRDGDAFVPLGAPGRQTVSDFLTNTKWPAERRAGVVCLCDDLGIVYLAPLRIDERVKVTPATRRIVRIAVESRPSGGNAE